MAETAVIVPNWNGAHLLPASISALATQTYRDFALYIVDNGSTDGSLLLLDGIEQSANVDWFVGTLPARAIVMRNATNLGFAEANNIAMRIAMPSVKNIVTLNNDAIPEPGWLDSLVSAAATGGSRLGMVASTMLFAHRPDRVASAGISIHRDGLALDVGVGARPERLEASGRIPVFGPSAGAALYKSAMLRDIGLFDNRFFSYLEDADLAWRARSRDWQCVYEPAARVLHEYSATGGEGSPFKSKLLARNRVWMLYKNMPQTLLARYVRQIARYEVASILGGLLSGRRARLEGRATGLNQLGDFTLDRRMNIAAARLHPEEMDRLLLPALTPLQHRRYRNRLALLLK